MIKKKHTKPPKEHFCLWCEGKLDFIPSEDGGFCCLECEDNWVFTGGITEDKQVKKKLNEKEKTNPKKKS